MKKKPITSLLVCLCVCLFICVFTCLFVCLLVCLCVYLFVFACLFVCFLVCLCACLFVCVFASLFVCLLDCLCVCLFVCVFVCLCVCLFVLFARCFCVALVHSLRGWLVNNKISIYRMFLFLGVWFPYWYGSDTCMHINSIRKCQAIDRGGTCRQTDRQTDRQTNKNERDTHTHTHIHKKTPHWARLVWRRVIASTTNPSPHHPSFTRRRGDSSELSLPLPPSIPPFSFFLSPRC